jgi:glutamate--cysteine ligase
MIGMARDTADETPIENLDQLAASLAAGCKPKDRWRIGTEHEKFGFYHDGHSPVPYEGPNGVKALLEGMEALLGWNPIYDDGKIIGLADPVGGGAISLEPGGQFELSGAPLETLHQTCREANNHLAQVRQVADPLGIGFLGLGMSPKWTREQTPVMPKSRYQIMANYMPKVGSRGLDMMFRTCTIQVNLDFSDETDMIRKLRVGLALQPNGFMSYRGEIWRDTDNQRSGPLSLAFDDGFGFEAYSDWALDVPMYFIVRDGKYRDMTAYTFRQYLDGAAGGDHPDAVPDMGDWTNHLSTMFPDVRLKTFLEMRGADGGPWRRICALPALWVGLLYDDAALAAAEELIADWSEEERVGLRDRVPEQGFSTPFRNRTVLDIAKDMVGISRDGLKARDRMSSGGYDEREYLAPLEENLALGKTMSESLLHQYKTRWGGSVEPVFDEWAY